MQSHHAPPPPTESNPRRMVWAGNGRGRGLLYVVRMCFSELSLRVVACRWSGSIRVLCHHAVQPSRRHNNHLRTRSTFLFKRCVLHALFWTFWTRSGGPVLEHMRTRTRVPVCNLSVCKLRLTFAKQPPSPRSSSLPLGAPQPVAMYRAPATQTRLYRQEKTPRPGSLRISNPLTRARPLWLASCLRRCRCRSILSPVAAGLRL